MEKSSMTQSTYSQWKKKECQAKIQVVKSNEGVSQCNVSQFLIISFITFAYKDKDKNEVQLWQDLQNLLLSWPWSFTASSAKSNKYSGVVSTGSTGSAKPVNFHR